MFIKLFKMNLAKAKKSYILLFLTLSFGVAALMVTLLIIRSQKMTEANRLYVYLSFLGMMMSKKFHAL